MINFFDDCCIPEPANPVVQWLRRRSWGRRILRLKIDIEQWKRQVEAEANGDFLWYGARYSIQFRSIVAPYVRGPYRSMDIRSIIADSKDMTCQ